MSELVIVQTQAANQASVIAAFKRLGTTAEVSQKSEIIARADRVVLPGVGSFAPVAERVRSLGLDHVLRERIEACRPTLAVCLGLHLLGDSSEEGGDARGLGILPLRATAFSKDVVTPQLGWNSIRAGSGCRLLSDGAAYFANSYRFTEGSSGWSVAWSDHGGPFVAALERGPVLACQFHPELSGAWGHSVIERWLATC